jgi:hypothetical protein
VVVGTTVTLAAAANQALAANQYLDVFDQTTATPVGTCRTATSCSLPVTQSVAGAHTYIADVDSDIAFEYPPCCVVAASNTVTVRWHARATAAFNVAFDVSGTLPAFPCGSGCSTGFVGTGHGSGSAEAEDVSGEYAGAFAMTGATVAGSAVYAEPGAPVCPGVGSATGTVTLSGPATGALWRTGTPNSVGTITAATFTLVFSYERVGATTAITVTGGSAVVHFTFPDTGADYFVAAVQGAGAGAFAVNPLQVHDDCASAGPLDFTVAGNAALTLT